LKFHFGGDFCGFFVFVERTLSFFSSLNDHSPDGHLMEGEAVEEAVMFPEVEVKMRI
jgi:hypothetical protein